MLFKNKMKSRLVEPNKLHYDLENFYLSKYLINELRDFYTAKEQESFYKSRSPDSKGRMTCKKPWPICYLCLEKSRNSYEPHTILLSTHFILSNFNLGHFVGRKPTPTSQSPIADVSATQKVREEDLLIERQRHVCEFRDLEMERLKSEVRHRISKQLSNPDSIMSKPKPSPMVKQNSMEVNQAYMDYMRGYTKGRRDTLVSQEDRSDYSQSIGSKPSHDITNYQNTRNCN